MNILITAGPTREPIDAVRYLGNRSSGQMGVALCSAALEAGHRVSAIVGPVSVSFPAGIARTDIETADQLQRALLAEFPHVQLLVMAAAVADYRPRTVSPGKLQRAGELVIECEPTPDLLQSLLPLKRPDQRIVGFSLESPGEIDRARAKLAKKQLDLCVYNPLATMNSASIDAVLLWPSGREERLGALGKADFAKVLLDRATKLF